jgi:RNA polymerase sigma-70 factor (ECF subfamily)
MATLSTDEIARRLYAEHSAALRAYVTRLLHDRDHAEDVVQETMLRAWQHADRLNIDGGSAWPWLRRVAHNLAVDRIRAQRRRPTEVDESAAYSRAVSDDHADRVITALTVGGVVRRLAPRQRDLLCQMYVADRGTTGSAGALGIPVGTVKSRLHHTLNQLRQTMPTQAAA